MLKLLLCLCFLFCSEKSPQGQVWTNSGYLRGNELETPTGRKYLAFHGVPYAKPPLDNLRFRVLPNQPLTAHSTGKFKMRLSFPSAPGVQDPVELGRWEGILDATTARDGCIQASSGIADHLGSEDCLYLNVYTPTSKYSSLLPVLVYFEGGYLRRGGGVGTRGPEPWMDEKVVVVTVSYRLGVLGFLSFGDTALPGNLGLRDQLLALKWIRQNISAFGGHPKKITIAGQGAAAASVGFHLVSPRSKGLFQRALTESGSAYSSWSLLEAGEAREIAWRTARLASCMQNSSAAAVDCLRTKPLTNILRLLHQSTLRDRDVLYGAVVENSSRAPFLPSKPMLLDAANVPWLSGYNSGDGLKTTQLYTRDPTFDWNDVDKNFTSYLRGTRYFFNIHEDERKVAELREFYFGSSPLGNSSYQNMTNLITDAGFGIPVIQSSRFHKGPLFLYEFDYVGVNSFTSILGARRVAEGACHGDEKIYIWNLTGTFSPLQGDDANLSRSLVKLWTNFVKYGSPTTKDSVIQWQRYDKSSKIFRIHNGGFSMEKCRSDDRERLWIKLGVLDQ